MAIRCRSAWAWGIASARVSRTGGTGAGHDVFALSVDEVIALQARPAGRAAACHGDAGRGVLAKVAEHHRLDVDRRTEVMGNAGRLR